MKTETNTVTKTETTTAAPVLHRIYTTPKHHAEHSALPGRLAIDLGKRTANRALATGPLLDMMHAEAPDLHKHALIVGSWVWVQPPLHRADEPLQERVQLQECGGRASQLHLILEVTDQPLAGRVAMWRLVTTG